MAEGSSGGGGRQQQQGVAERRLLRSRYLAVKNLISGRGLAVGVGFGLVLGVRVCVI